MHQRQQLNPHSFAAPPLRVDSRRAQWQASPAPGVSRKRLYRADARAGATRAVTSLVRYAPGARFPQHPHPGGEEILVLDGVFCDQMGRWPAGTLLLHPEGYSHSPYSEEGCLLLVRLQQYAGVDRYKLALNLNLLPWETCTLTGIERKQLYAQNAYPDWLSLEQWPSCCEPGLRVYQGGAEIFVLEGELCDESGCHGAGCWLRFAAGAQHRPYSPEGCLLYIRQGQLRFGESLTAAD